MAGSCAPEALVRRCSGRLPSELAQWGGDLPGQDLQARSPLAGVAFAITTCFVHSVPCAAANSTPSTAATTPSQLCQAKRVAFDSVMPGILPRTLPSASGEDTPTQEKIRNCR